MNNRIAGLLSQKAFDPGCDHAGRPSACKLVDVELLPSVFVKSFIATNINNINNADANFTATNWPNKRIDEIKTWLLATNRRTSCH
jgi:hypothetical protein